MNTAQISLAAACYPTRGRASGVSWMLGIGQFGGIAESFLVAEPHPAPTVARRYLSRRPKSPGSTRGRKGLLPRAGRSGFGASRPLPCVPATVL